MSIFNANNVPAPTKKDFPGVPEGKYQAKITKAEVKKTQQGHRAINLHVKTDKGVVFSSLNFDHPSCQTITQQTVKKILDSYENPPTEINTIEELSSIVTGLPVQVFVKDKGTSDSGHKQYSVYFNDIDKALKVKFENGAPKKRVEY